MNVKLTKTQRILVETPKDIAHIMQQILLRENRISRSREHFWVVGLSNTNKILYIELVSLGALMYSAIEPMEVFSFALQKKTVRMLLIHNISSGDLKPNAESKKITNRMIQVGNIVGIEVYDHVIIAPFTYYSFEENGVMDKLRDSVEFVPPYKREETIRKIIEKQAVHEIARKMKKKGTDVKMIAELTGLTLREVEKI